MIKAFVDADVILDLLMHRVPHFHFAALLFTFADMGKLELYTSPAVLVQVGTILKKQLGNEDAKRTLRKLRLLLHVTDSNEKVLDLALNSDSAVFSDAINYYTAEANGLTFLIVRSRMRGKASGPLILTPEMFLKQNGFLE